VCRLKFESVARMSAAKSGASLTIVPDVAEFIIGRAFARPVGSSGLRAAIICSELNRKLNERASWLETREGRALLTMRERTRTAARKVSNPRKFIS
jgi:hypothetical protein